MSEKPSVRSRRSFLHGAGVAGSALALGGIVSSRSGQAWSGDSDELLVGTTSPGDVSTLGTTVQHALPANAKLVKENATLGFTVVEVEADGEVNQNTVDELEDELTSYMNIDYVERNTTHETFEVAVADDPLLDEQYAPQQCNALEAWETELGSNDVTISIVDQGLDYEHPNFVERIADDPGQDFVWWFRDDPAPIFGSIEFHGTHVGGIATATTGNGEGIAGISNSEVISARALSSIGFGSTDAIAEAIQWSAEQGADLINLSLGGGGETETMRNAVQFAYENGSLPIAAAGNDGDRGASFPAAYDEVMAVSAVDSNEELAEFSQFGPEIEVTAPGVDVLSTMPGDDHAPASGTSMSCPAATGVAALGLAAADGDLTPDELRELLKSTARDIGLDEEEQGAGHVDAAAIVEEVQ